MKIVELYICEICHTQYANKKMAEECEAKHIKPKSVNDLEFYYKPYTMLSTGMPHKIVMRDERGIAYTYKR